MVRNFLSRIRGGIEGGVEKVSLESTQFEDQFDVYSTDQVEARYLLTPEFMDRLLQSKYKFGVKPYLAFAEGQIFLALDNRKIWFGGPGGYPDLTDTQQVESLAYALDRITNTVEYFTAPLNTRI